MTTPFHFKTPTRKMESQFVCMTPKRGHADGDYKVTLQSSSDKCCETMRVEIHSTPTRTRVSTEVEQTSDLLYDHKHSFFEPYDKSNEKAANQETCVNLEESMDFESKSIAAEDFDHECSVIFNREDDDLSVDNSVCSDDSDSLNYLYEQLQAPLTVNDQLLIKTIIKEMERTLKPRIAQLQETAAKYDRIKQLYNIPSIGDLKGDALASLKKKWSHMKDHHSASSASSKKRKLSEYSDRPLFELSYAFHKGSHESSYESSPATYMSNNSRIESTESGVQKDRVGLGISVSETHYPSPVVSPKRISKLSVENISHSDESHAQITNYDIEIRSVNSNYMDLTDDLLERSKSLPEQLCFEKDIQKEHISKSFEQVRTIFNDIEASRFSNVLEYCLSKFPSQSNEEIARNPIFFIEGYTSFLDSQLKRSYSTKRDYRLVKDISFPELRIMVEQHNGQRKRSSISNKVHALINKFEKNDRVEAKHVRDGAKTNLAKFLNWRVREVPNGLLSEVFKYCLEKKAQENSTEFSDKSFREFLREYFAKDAHFRAQFVENYHRQQSYVPNIEKRKLRS